MQIKLLTNLGTNEFPEHRFLEGEEHEVDTSFGALLVRRRLAIDVTPPPPVVAVAKTPGLIGIQEEPVAEPVAPAKPKKSKGE